MGCNRGCRVGGSYKTDGWTAVTSPGLVHSTPPKTSPNPQKLPSHHSPPSSASTSRRRRRLPALLPPHKVSSSAFSTPRHTTAATSLRLRPCSSRFLFLRRCSCSRTFFCSFLGPVVALREGRSSLSPRSQQVTHGTRKPLEIVASPAGAAAAAASVVRTRQGRGRGAALLLPLLSATTRSCCCSCCISAALFKEPVFTAATPFPFFPPLPSFLLASLASLPSRPFALYSPPDPQSRRESTRPSVPIASAASFPAGVRVAACRAWFWFGVLVSSFKAREVLAHLSFLVRFVGLRLASLGLSV